MAITFSTTKDAKKQGINVLVYGRPGVGKTVLCATTPRPIIISAESGLLSIADFDPPIPVLAIENMADLQDAYEFVTKKKNLKKYDTICIDSITDVAEALLADLKRHEKDPRQAYGKLADQLGDLIRNFRDIKGKHVYMTAKSKKSTSDGDSEELFTPSMPGNVLTNSIAFWFDEVLALRMSQDDDDDDSGGKRYLQTQPDYKWDAKDRSGKLDPIEKPHLAESLKKSQNKEKLWKSK